MQEPVIHETRNEARGLRFTETHVMVDLADGRIIGVPLHFFPLLEAATDAEKENYRLYGLSIYWDDIDDGIDLTAMISGLYIPPTREYLEELRLSLGARLAATT
ncbi:MAG: DUF2442 domain-containing protein [Chloroflexi bacterium]|nr:DUF2442 domain-containing protein [Chloroflexota bacterium]MCY3716901.1 DUF2442 domain-containing protein [Chloroflexota bacterium]MDE2650115.1 DUF2442 domain-containing protein [Chloroflexota bacterium]MXV92986.1 DUF2442 domain-containing protein [Chloroflexota bacterium]MXX50275.1 DUF2442 domain-containing protein [Chloroflexota bacterium]